MALGRRKNLSGNARTEDFDFDELLDDEKVFPALAAGAKGYILKTSQAAEIASAIRKVASGQDVLSGAVKEKSINKSIENLNCMTIFQKRNGSFENISPGAF